jgi:hypothetical protein
MYFPDLSPYSFMGEEDPGAVPLLNVGWLDDQHDFATADPSEELLSLLLRACEARVGTTRGWHQCELCRADPPITVKWGKIQLSLGGAEIRVTGASGTRYASPDMVYHYVEVHHYVPPRDFVEGLVLHSQ